jgi:hypothetical protein
MSRVFDIEYSALQMLDEGERRATKEGITVWLAAINPNVLACIRASRLGARLGERLLSNAREAIRKYQDEFAAGDIHSQMDRDPANFSSRDLDA